MKVYFKFIYLFIGITVLSCGSSDEDIATINASFEFQPTEAFIGSTINFTNTSNGIDQSTVFSWDFGDGTTSTQKNPTHIYTEIGNGIYKIELKVSNDGNQSIIEKEISISYSNDISGKIPLIEKLDDDKILTCAHRGYHNNNPENSLASIAEAIIKGIEIVEIDIRQSKDSYLVLMHDETIDRTTNGSGKVSDFSLSELMQFKLYNNKGVLTNEKVPTLQEVLSVGRGKIYFDLDISKKAAFESVYPVVKQYGMLKQSFFYSSELDVIKDMLNKDTDVVAMPIIDGDDRFSDYENLSNIKIVHYTNGSFNQRLVDKAKEKGWYIFMNAYVNTETIPDDDNYGQVDKINILDGNIIQTDHPVLVKEYLK